MRLSLIASLLIVAALCADHPASCQQSTPVLPRASDSTLDRAVLNEAPAIEIDASQDASNASLKFGRVISTAGDQGLGIFSSLILTASSPIEKEEDTTQLATLDGLSNAFSVGLKYTHFTVTDRRNPANDPRLDLMCGELTRAYQKSTRKTDEPLCDLNTGKQYLPARRYAEFKSLFWGDVRKWAWGIEPKIGYQKFKFLKPGTTDEVSESKVPWSLELFHGFMEARSRTFITVGAEYQHGFKDADSTTRCPTPNLEGTVDCKTGASGEPVEDNAELLFVEMRRRIYTRALSLKVTYDFEEEVIGADLPIHLLTNKDGNLTGGIRVGWTEDEHWQAGIFVGTAFRLF